MHEVAAGNDGATMAGRRIGPHLPLGAGLLKAADRAHEIGATAIQIFTDNPTAWKRRQAAPPELPAFRERLTGYGIAPVAVHGPYLINLCGGDPVFWERSVATLVNELRVAADYGASFVNVHIGSHKGLGRQAGIEQLTAGVRRVLDESARDGPADRLPMLVLENSAGTGDGIGSTIEDLADIVEAAARAGAPSRRLGICLDTAHLWAAGYDISGESEVDGLVSRADDLLGIDRLVMLHLNDARTVLGSRLDRHEHIGAGLIPQPGLRQVLRHPRLSHLPVYLETPGMDSGYDAVNLERVRLLLAGEPLPELPPEAFTARGARSRSGPPASGADEAVA